MPIENEEVRRIAELAQIEMDDEHARRLVPQIATILEHVAAVSRLDVRNVPPMAHPGSSPNVREDVIVPSLPAETALRSAPAKESGHFVVPRVLNR